MGSIADLEKKVKELSDNIEKHVADDSAKKTLLDTLHELEVEVTRQAVTAESKLLEVRKSVVQSEVESNFWLQRSWRPITMLTFVALVVLHSFGALIGGIPPQMWVLLQIGLGGYVVGRSVEKIVDKVKTRIGSS